MQPEIQNRLRNALTGRQTVEMGQFQWVNLDMVRREAGEDWERLRRKIYNVSAQFIERRLDEGDVLLRAKGGFMLIFGQREGDDAAEKVEEIALALNVFFLGDRILRSLKIEAEARSLSPEEFLQIVAVSEPMDAVDADAEEHDFDAEDSPDGALANWRQQEAPAPEDETGVRRRAMGSAADVQPPDWRASAEAEPREDDPEWKRQGSPAAPSRTGDWRALDRESPTEEDVRWEEGRPSFSREKQPRWEAVQTEKRKSGGVALPKSEFVEPSAQWDDIIFRPCWDSVRSAMSLHFCLARRRYRGQVLYGRDTLLGNPAANLHRALDRSVAIAAQRAFQKRFSEKSVCAIGIPVHYDTIAKVSDRVSYFSVLQSVPQQLRKYFFLRVDGIPRGAPVAQMQEVFRSMKGFGSNVLAKLDFGDIDLRRFEGCGIDYFGCDLPRNFGNPDKADKNVMTLMELVAAARLLKAETYLTQVDDFDALNMGVAAGVRLMSGDAVSLELALPEQMRRVDLAELAARSRPDEDDADAVLL